MRGIFGGQSCKLAWNNYFCKGAGIMMKKLMAAAVVFAAVMTAAHGTVFADTGMQNTSVQNNETEEALICTDDLSYDVERFAAPEGTKTLVVVEGFAVNGGRDTYKEGYVSDSGRWNQVRVTAFYRENDEAPFEPEVQTKGVMGWSGMKNDRHPGDGSTPIGFFRMNTPFGRQPAEEGFPKDYTEIMIAKGNQYWSDSTNRLETSNDFSQQNGERLYESWAAKIYDYCIDMGYNRIAEEHKGSALFMHCTKPGKPSTAGCVAIDTEAMKAILKMTARGENSAVVAIAPAGSFEQVYHAFSEEGISPAGEFPASDLVMPETETIIMQNKH